MCIYIHTYIQKNMVYRNTPVRQPLLVAWLPEETQTHTQTQTVAPVLPPVGLLGAEAEPRMALLFAESWWLESSVWA